MNAKLAIALLLGICTVGAVELGSAALAYRQRINDGDWVALAAATATIPETEPILLAQPWLGPRARMGVPSLRSPKRVTPPDLRGVSTLHTVGLDDIWSSSLERYQEGGPQPRLVETTRVGAFTLARWVVAPEVTRWDWTVGAPAMSTDGGRCNGKGNGPWKCPEGRIKLEYGEVDYVPRYALWANLGDGATLTAEASVELGDRLRGHIGFSDFNARLRSDGPVRVEVRVDGVTELRFVATDTEGWRPFEVPTTPGTARVEIALTSAVRGTWGRKGYGMPPARLVGFEMRALEDAP